MTTQADLEQRMRDLAQYIDENTGPRASFTLIIWPEDAAKLTNYISNADRADVIQALRETADRLETRADMPPAVGGVQ